MLLRAPQSILIERLSAQTTNDYDKARGDLARVLQHMETAEPLLRRVATVEIDTSLPLDEVVRLVEDLVRG